MKNRSVQCIIRPSSSLYDSSGVLNLLDDKCINKWNLLKIIIKSQQKKTFIIFFLNRHTIRLFHNILLKYINVLMSKNFH